MNIDRKNPDIESFPNLDNIEILRKLFINVKKRSHLDSSELLNRLEEKEVLIPVTIFSRKLSSLEIITKYLKENLELKNKEIASLTKRSVKTIYQAYSSANEKARNKFEIREAKYYIPASALTNRKFGVLESVAKYLKENYELNYSEIGRLLERDLGRSGLLTLEDEREECWIRKNKKLNFNLS